MVFKKWVKNIQTVGYTSKSLSEALIFASTNPQYDDRLFIEFPEKDKFTLTFKTRHIGG